MITIAQEIAALPDPYQHAVAKMEYRLKNTLAGTVTMFFVDGSSMTFRISYTVDYGSLTPAQQLAFNRGEL
jgi:hypothetical protein